VLEERNRISRECHDTLMAGFAAISWQLEATAKLFRDSDSASTPAAKSCELARSMVSHCQAEARRIIWDLRDTEEVTNILSQALSRTLATNHMQEVVRITLDVEGDEVPLTPGCVHHLVCIGQEAVSNAIRHAQPSSIAIRLKYESDALNLSIRDDGRGFYTSDRSGGYGQSILQRNAAAGQSRASRYTVDWNMKQICVLLIEDHFLARMALHSVLSGHPQIRVIGEAGDGDLGMTMYRTLRPDVVVLDLRLPRVSGFDVIIQLRKEFPTARIVVLSNYQGSEDIYRAVRSGAMAYLTKDASGEELLSAIQNVHRGLRYLPHVALDRLAERMPSVELTPRETEVLACITQGRSNREIAEDLHIAEKTVRIHVSSVLDKMGARDRTQATIYALQRGIVHLE
jgi:DNA-binding NarL/FixJ family response regulator/anti-sigma regulatory factor (Ser/Thr protein kinase)